MPISFNLENIPQGRKCCKKLMRILYSDGEGRVGGASVRKSPPAGPISRNGRPRGQGSLP